MKPLLMPLTVKNLNLKNRIVMPPLANNLAKEDGSVTSALITHYSERAKSGLGMIIVEHSYVHPSGRFNDTQLGIHEDHLVDGLRQLVDEIKKYGVVVGIQLNHAGGTTAKSLIGQQPLAPSPVKHPWGKEEPQQIEATDLSVLANHYSQAAQRAKEAGFDFVEIHGAHGYLLNQFYSPLTNQRDDNYGGSQANRLRFPLEVVQTVRKTVGPDYVVLYRLGADDLLPEGLTVDDAVYAASRLVEAGVDLLDISGGLRGYQPKDPTPPFFTYLSSAVKQVVDVPVLVTGGIREPEMANEIVEQGQADLVGIGRSLLNNPNWANKAKSVLSS